MMIYVNNRSPKKLRMQRKKRLAKKQEQYQEWLASLEKLKPNFGTPGTKKSVVTIHWKRLEVLPLSLSWVILTLAQK
jgi:hypothetical protein